MSSMLPSISPELARIAPGFRALSINVIAAPIRDAQVGEIALKEACQAVINGQPAWAQAQTPGIRCLKHSAQNQSAPPARLKRYENAC